MPLSNNINLTVNETKFIFCLDREAERKRKLSINTHESYIYEKSRMVALKLNSLQGKKQNKNMLDFKLSLILNDGMMKVCKTKIFAQNKHGIHSA